MYTPQPMSVPPPEISMTPLIGVLQVLLFVFLFSSPPRDQAQPFHLGVGYDCWNDCPTVLVRTVEIKANPRGSVDLSLEGDPVDFLMLLARLRQYRGDDRIGVSVDTGMDVPYGELARLLAKLKRAGFEDIRFAEFQRSRPLDRDSWRRGW